MGGVGWWGDWVRVGGEGVGGVVRTNSCRGLSSSVWSLVRLIVGWLGMILGLMELLPSFMRARLSAAAVISLSSSVLICCFRALLHFVPSAARPSHDMVSMCGLYMCYCSK